MLKLQDIKETYCEIELLDNSILHIAKPTQALWLTIYDKLVGEEHLEKLTQKEANELTCVVAQLILNNNIDGVTFTPEAIKKDFKAEHLEAIINYYVAFVAELKNDPN